MAYQPVTYNTGAAPGLDGPAFNAIETQYAEAINSLHHETVQPFVEYGLVATKDGTVATKLNVTAGVAWLNQSYDGTRRYRAPTSTSFTTSAPSATYYLDVQSDGTWSWGTAHSSDPNYLAIAQVTTDGASNIATVTDARSLALRLFANAQGPLLYGDTQVLTNPTTITNTASHTLLSYTPPVPALYRVSMTFRQGNGSAQNIIASVSYTDQAGAGRTRYLAFVGPGAAGVIVANGSTSFINADVFNGLAQLIDAAAGSAITISYQDPGGSPNDGIHAVVLERVG